MKIAVIGAGAMGSLFGALLAEGGHEVWLCDIWPDHIKTLKQNGLKIEWEGKTRNVRLDATGDPQQIGESELVLIFVKSTKKASFSKARHLVVHGALSGTIPLVRSLFICIDNASVSLLIHICAEPLK